MSTHLRSLVETVDFTFTFQKVIFLVAYMFLHHRPSLVFAIWQSKTMKHDINPRHVSVSIYKCGIDNIYCAFGN